MKSPGVQFVRQVLAPSKVSVVFSCHSYFYKGLVAKLNVGEAERRATEGKATALELLWVQIYVLLIINVWEFCQKSWSVVPFVLQCLFVAYVLNGTQMWFIVRGMMQLEKTGLYKAMQTWAGKGHAWATCSCGWQRTAQGGLCWDWRVNNMWKVVLSKENGFLSCGLGEQS